MLRIFFVIFEFGGKLGEPILSFIDLYRQRYHLNVSTRGFDRAKVKAVLQSATLFLTTFGES